MTDPQRQHFRMTVSYDGTNYCGWQFQANGNTVQQELEEAIADVTDQKVRISGSGRTDSGVHALAQVASFTVATRLTASDFLRALNGNLPLDVRVLNVENVAEDFCALRSAKRKKYAYVLQDGTQHDVIHRKHCWFVPGRLDESAMQEAANNLVGEYDFVSFQGSGSERATTVRRVESLTVTRLPTPELSTTSSEIHVSIAANGFLYRMVRNIVGTLVEVGQGRAAIDWPAEVLVACDRKRAGMTAPAHGLFLVRVDY